MRRMLLLIVFCNGVLASGTGVNGPDTEGEEIPVIFDRVVLEKDIDRVTARCMDVQFMQMCAVAIGGDRCDLDRPGVIENRELEPGFRYFSKKYKVTSYVTAYGLYFSQVFEHSNGESKLRSSSVGLTFGLSYQFRQQEMRPLPYISYYRDIENLEVDALGGIKGSIGARNVKVVKSKFNKIYMINEKTQQKSKLAIDTIEYTDCLIQGTSAL